LQFAKLLLLTIIFNLALPGQYGATPLATLPPMLEADSGEQTILVTGDSFEPGWKVLWNGSPRETEFVSPYRLRVSLLAADTAVATLSAVSVVDQGNQLVRPASPVWVYIPLANLDIVHHAPSNRLLVAVPKRTGQRGPGIAVVNPSSGWIDRFLPTSIEANRLHLTPDNRFLYLAGSGRILRLNLASFTLDLDFPLPVSAASPPETHAMISLPGNPDVLVVSIRIPFQSPSNAGTIVFDRGVRRGTGALPLFDGPRDFSGWTPDGKLIGTNSTTIYTLSLLPDGLKADNSWAVADNSANRCKFLEGLLYCDSGMVFDSASGTPLRSYPAKGALALQPDSDRIAFFDTGNTNAAGLTLCPLTAFTRSSAEAVFSALVPTFGGNTFGPLLPIGNNVFVWRDAGSNGINSQADRLYVFQIQ
jgi:hypothetical protein